MFKSIKSRLIVWFGITFVLLFVLLGFIDNIDQSAITTSKQLSEREMRVERLTLTSQILFKTQIQEWKDILLRGHNAEDYQKYFHQFIANESETAATVEQLIQALSEDSKAKQLARKFLKGHQWLGEQYRSALQKHSLTEPSSVRLIDKEVRGIDRKPIQLLETIVAIIKAEGQIRQAELDKKFQLNEQEVLIVLLLVSAILLIGFLMTLNKGICSPLVDFTVRLRQIADGDKDLTQRFEQVGVSELNNLVIWFNVFVENIQKLMVQINDAASNLSAASQTSAKINEQTNQSIQTQQTAIEKVCESMNQMTEAVTTIAKNAVQAHQSADNTMLETEENSQAVKETVKEIEQLSRQIGHASEVVDKVYAESEKINSILKTISEITEQTNLLALNAAIEAARAGEYGRGFAVVADEVRGLANKTQSATVEIQSMIAGMQKEVTNAVQAMQISREQASKTCQLSTAAGDSLQGIIGAVADISQKNQQIAKVCQQQSTTAYDINQLIININQSVAETMNSAMQNTSDSSDLAQLSILLNSLINQFKISQTQSGPIQTLGEQPKETDVELF